MRHECLESTGLMFNESEMSALAERTISRPLILSAADFHAKTSVAPESEQALLASVAASGMNTPVLLANFDPDTFLWKTFQRSLDEGYQTFSERWPRSGTIRNGIAFRLPTLAHRTDATESLLWPTPDASVANDGEGLGTWLARRERVKARKINGNGFGTPLAIAVKLRPGPEDIADGNLNPPWVEWLMGFPLGWTDLED